MPYERRGSHSEWTVDNLKFWNGVTSTQTGGTADLIGTSIDNVKLRLEKVGSPTGTAEVGVWNSANTKVHSFGNYDMSTATYSEYGIVVPSSEGTSSVSGTEYVQYTGNTSGATCDANTGNWQGGTQSYHNMYIETGGWCVFPVLKYDISSALPSGKYAKSIERLQTK